jgi:hypothetical protein
MAVQKYFMQSKSIDGLLHISDDLCVYGLICMHITVKSVYIPAILRLICISKETQQ